MSKVIPFQRPSGKPRGKPEDSAPDGQRDRGTSSEGKSKSKSQARKKQRSRRKGNESKTLCRSGFHKWKPDTTKQFEVKRGKLVSIMVCARCGERKTTLT